MYNDHNLIAYPNDILKHQLTINKRQKRRDIIQKVINGKTPKEIAHEMKIPKLAILAYIDEFIAPAITQENIDDIIDIGIMPYKIGNSNDTNYTQQPAKKLTPEDKKLLEQLMHVLNIQNQKIA